MISSKWLTLNLLNIFNSICGARCQTSTLILLYFRIFVVLYFCDSVFLYYDEDDCGGRHCGVKIIGGFGEPLTRLKADVASYFQTGVSSSSGNMCCALKSPFQTFVYCNEKYTELSLNLCFNNITICNRAVDLLFHQTAVICKLRAAKRSNSTHRTPQTLWEHLT